MPIDLGLSRIAKLLSHLNNPHLKYKSIHLAGTNGKGSTLAYISSILTQTHKIKNGKFTSPHLIELNDCITINNKIYPRTKFDDVNKDVLQIDEELKLRCTEFEILAATAFKIFEIEKVELALIEVGVGGRLDATNVLEPYNSKENGGVVATGITKIGMDHEKLLGDSIQLIAKEKAGIVKPNIPCFIDSSNDTKVIDVIKEACESNSSNAIIVKPSEESEEFIKLSPLKGQYQVHNLSLALALVEYVNRTYYNNQITKEIINEGIQRTNWPGRLQYITIPQTSRKILLDGAHNESAAIELGKFLKQTYPNEPKIFIIGVTKGKNLNSILKHLVSPNDIIIPSSFNQPEQMPWITSESISKIEKSCHDLGSTSEIVSENAYIEDVFNHLKNNEKLKDQPIIICGSLYLCGDVLRYVRDK
ncbi:FOL3 [Candida pseudojiufengensis]|uniref:FOL3 n=1 Tax=Candida pseudojiufengensis TaxID=497109 RepID=UPI002225B27E|nr:FOL3 [Candida pseudojiufengensis]KAI5960792.1 FOL3 [Candida pseudojiufengensis]